MVRNDSFYDVVIVGAGPAGAAVAFTTAKLGLKTVIVEQMPEPEHRVRCGEFMPGLEEIFRIIPEKGDFFSLLLESERFSTNITREISLVSPFGYERRVNFGAYVIDRRRYVQWMVGKAVDMGAELLLNTRCVQLEIGGEGVRGVVVKRKGGDQKVLKGNVIVGADGADSSVAKQGSMFRSYGDLDLVTTRQYVMENFLGDEDVCRMYIGQDYSPGAYAWIIPKGEGTVNVGTGIRKPYLRSGDTLRGCLQRFIKDHPQASNLLKDATVKGVISAHVPVGGSLEKTFWKNVLLVGDAAGQVIVHVGAGMPPAIIAGEIAGQTITKYLEGNTPLSDYEKIWKSILQKPIKNGLYIRKLWDKIAHNDKKAEKFLKIIRHGMLEKMIRAKIPITVRLFAPIITKIL
ncbi:MAG: geranylgeranyl reductase family protein [Candidatus Wukongarchaeota archaeon]|nr:geranylgeranyl reductase family protein [Candidatus Wukongarchaeota archaeon]